MTSARPLWRGRALALVGIVLFAFSLRSAVASLSPLIAYIQADFALSPAVIGLIGTAPPVCYAVFGILTPRFERRWGLERLTLIALVIVTIGLLARGFATHSVTLLGATALIFSAVAVGNILLPPLVKKYFADRIALITTIYSTTMALATLTPPLIAVPVADASSWRVSLGLWALFAALATLPWITLVRTARAAAAAAADIEVPTPAPQVFRRLLRLPLAWAVMVGFMVSGVIAYTSFAWLPQILVDVAGVTPATAGALLALFAATGFPASLVVPILVTKFHATRTLFMVAAGVGLVAVGGLLLAPQAAPWLWVILLGAPAMLFPLTLVLLGIRTRTHEATVALSGFVQSVGYAFVALFPLGIGLLHDATQSWTLTLIVLGVVIALAIPAGVIAARPHTIEEEWERRHEAW